MDYERRLHHALRQDPIGYDMWALIGKPSRNHRAIVRMLLHTLDVCNDVDAEYWADWGTIIGVVRHRNVIPWDWDFDLSFRTADFNKMKALERTSHPVYGWRWYEDPPAVGYKGYAGKGYSVYLRETEHDAAGGCLGDIVEYRDAKKGEDPEAVHCAVEDWEYPNERLSDIYPLVRYAFLGTSITLPHNFEAIVKYYETEKNVIYAKVGWQEYDPVPFLLSHMTNPHLEVHCRIPVRDCEDSWIRRNVSTTPTTVLLTTRHEHTENVTRPVFETVGSPHTSRVLAGRFEFLAVPATHAHHVVDTAATVDELLWDLGPGYPLWGEMVGGFLMPCDEVTVPEGWLLRYRVVLAPGRAQAVRVSND